MLVHQLAKFLKNERLKRGVSQQKFAEILDLHPNYLGGLERAERNPSLSCIQQISKKLEVDLKLLFKEPKN